MSTTLWFDLRRQSLVLALLLSFWLILLIRTHFPRPDQFTVARRDQNRRQEI